MSPLNLFVQRCSRKLDFPIPCQHRPVLGQGGHAHIPFLLPLWRDKRSGGLAWGVGVPGSLPARPFAPDGELLVASGVKAGSFLFACLAEQQGPCPGAGGLQMPWGGA